jgi:hypothetical protein
LGYSHKSLLVYKIFVAAVAVFGGADINCKPAPLVKSSHPSILFARCGIMPAVLDICKFELVVELVATNATEGLEPSIKTAGDSSQI